MSVLGLGLLVLVGLALVLTGLPAFAVLIFAALVGALSGLATGAITPGLLGVLPGRLINLLENDLLQALPLFVLMGVLLNRMEIASAVFRTLAWLLPRRAGGPVVAGLGLGALLAPMSGSVGASVLALSHTVEPMLVSYGVRPEMRHAAIAVASTLGVVIPPSLVLILLGDAMLTAHTIAADAMGRMDRIVNTQDVLRAAILPAGLFVLLSLAVGWLAGNRGEDGAAKPGTPLPSWSELIVSAVSVLFIVVLLGGVAAGRFFPVEAAALGAFVLFAAGIATRRITPRTLGPMLGQILATTGALFAPLLAATTFTLVLRLLGTDRLIEHSVLALPGGEMGATAAVLGALFAAGFVLDAFEIIFVAVPILIPALLMRVADAAWVGTLVLLTLQASFLLPPVGYALMMARASLKSSVATGATMRALAPFLAAQVSVLALTLAVPAIVHMLDPADVHSRGPAHPAAKDGPDALPQVPPLPIPGPIGSPPPFPPEGGNAPE
jgi:tripartite ATP-independent transporter DctM subunit